MDRDDILDGIHKYMHEHGKAAAEHFIKENPSLENSEWFEILDILLEGNAHAELTDAIYDDLKVVVPIGTFGWIVPVFLTLLYANKGRAPYVAEVAYWHGYVTGRAFGPWPKVA